MDYKSSFASTVTAKVITDLATKAASKLFTYLNKRSKKVAAEMQMNLGTAFQEYMDCAFEKYAKMKTLLYRHEPKDLYSFFEPVLICNAKSEIDTSDIHQLMQKGNHLLITGSGGTGKSVMMKHFLLDCLKKNLFVPILIELRSFNGKKFDDVQFIDHIYENLNALNFKIEKEYFFDSLNSDIYLFLFDGYDELSSDIVNDIGRNIKSFCAKYRKNHFIVSSRPSMEFVGWQIFKEYQMMPLKKVQALSLINRLEYDTITKQNFYTALDEKFFERYESFASIPLLLTIMLITYEYGGYIPENINNFFEQAFFALFYTHDFTKDGYKRVARTSLCYEEFKMIFSYFCFKTYFADRFEFTGSQVIGYIQKAKERYKDRIIFECHDYLLDLTHYVCMLVSEGLNYKFSHRSFQEYFAAVFTAQLPDDIFERLLRGHLQKKSMDLSYEYYDMLNLMQHSRFTKNFLYPELCQLRDLINSNRGSVFEVLKLIFYSISIHEEGGSMIGFGIRDELLFGILRLAPRLLDFKASGDPESRRSKTDALVNAIIVKFANKSRSELSEAFSFEELEHSGLKIELLEYMSPYCDRIEFLMNWLQNYELSRIDSNADFDTLSANL